VRAWQDEGLRHIRGLPHLQRLLLFNTLGVTDAGLAHVATLENIEMLQVCADISDAGLTHLSKLKKLKSLDVAGFITAEGAARLQRSLPQTKIMWRNVVPAAPDRTAESLSDSPFEPTTGK
jgi:hypothetical protein